MLCRGAFIAYLENPQDYLEPDFKFIEGTDSGFPVGQFKQLIVSFVHYKSSEDAINKWIERSKRIIWDNIYIIATGHDGLEEKTLMERFDKLPYKNKIMFTHHEWPEYSWAKHVKLLENVAVMPPLTEFASLDGKRLYDTAFDIAEWISECEKKRKIQ